MAIALIILFELLESGLHSEFIGPRYGTLGEFNHKVDQVLACLRGIMAVVCIKSREKFSESLGRRLFLSACMIWKLGNISMPEPIPIPLKPSVWEDLFQYDLGTYNDTYRLLPPASSRIAVRKGPIEKTESQPNLEDMITVLRDAQSVDDDLVAWHLYEGAFSPHCPSRTTFAPGA
jgi:hypothetical protein